jgi:glucans biosynthesis protein
MNAKKPREGTSADRPRGARPDEEAIGRMLASRRCGALTRIGGLCRAPAVKDRLRCRKHGGAAGAGAPKGNRNARKHGLYAAAERAEHRRIMDFVRECNRVLDEFHEVYRKR